ncbi:bifunctional pyr operon transcriptional regulator/uracil phosphoribosyltransferase PyrR [Uliginosibacterium sediminicola]|jgi:pyrimidine operon attenuation protein/uracil phosphoribosyltransferase|uniref:Bifunctional pyr operon transcriptional regulator/uracil phosphoribosyltransferase PyrR n=1 Tax=Uliginosibacterium sediminicola TaxID=2024550 RepID=A0ABU9YTU5_9RHOO
MQLPDAEHLCAQLVALIRPALRADSVMIGIHTGGVWLAERLHAELGLAEPLGTLDVAFYRDDYNSRGLHARPRKSDIPFDIDGRTVILVDDVLFTGRTTRAALNELFDYGRPGRVELAVLADRGGRELPIAPSYCPLTLTDPLPAGASLQLSRAESGELSFRLMTDA